jgi:hypothetical protein
MFYLPQAIARVTCVSPSHFIGDPSQLIPNQTLYVPINIVVVNGEKDKISYDDRKILNIVEYSNEIWQVANISFNIVSIRYLSISDDRATPERDNIDKLQQLGRAVLGQEYEDGIIDVVYVKYFRDHRDGGGQTLQIGNVSSIFINEFEQDYRANWTLAHELGHTMNLKHVCGNDNLMFNANGYEVLENRPIKLTEEQAMTARYFTYNVHRPDFAFIRTP